jgi:hypothetical protein
MLGIFVLVNEFSKHKNFASKRQAAPLDLAGID